MDLIAESIVRLSEQGQAIGEIVATVSDLADQVESIGGQCSDRSGLQKPASKGRDSRWWRRRFGVWRSSRRKPLSRYGRFWGTSRRRPTGQSWPPSRGTKAVEAGVKQATQSGDSVKALAESITEASQAATQIAASSQQQQLGMDQVASAMENIKIATTLERRRSPAMRGGGRETYRS